MPTLTVARFRTALALAALATSCSNTPAPAAPAETVESGDGAEAMTPENAAPEDPTPEANEPVATESATAASAPAQGPKDSRGKQEIQQVMADNRDKVRACYDAALQQNPGIKGGLVIDFTIDPHGDVKQAEVNWSQSDLHIPELDTCAVDTVKSFKFPASSRGLESKVSYPFNFNPPRPGKPAPRQEPVGPAR
jgi:TonB family protein